jgi:hypothetical protein
MFSVSFIIEFFYFSPNGKLSKDQLIQKYEQLHPNRKAKDFCKYVFVFFDRDNTGTSKNKFKYLIKNILIYSGCR